MCDQNWNPDVWPPRTGWGAAQDGAVFGQGLVTGRLWGGVQFAVDFRFVSLSEQLFEPGTGATQFEDWAGGREWGQGEKAEGRMQKGGGKTRIARIDMEGERQKAEIGVITRGLFWMLLDETCH